ncbi:MAG TPA: hypothetical protein VGD64_06295 [Acidisarcina sp.]
MKQRGFDEAVGELRRLGFDVSEGGGVAKVAGASEVVLPDLRSRETEASHEPGLIDGRPAGMLVRKNGIGAVLVQGADGFAELSAQPGVMLGGEIARLLDRGYQKFFKTSTMEVPATAAQLRAVHDFTEELKLATGSVSLYNESLGTVSDRYMYDRVKGRDLPEAQRPARPWELLDEKQ